MPAPTTAAAIALAAAALTGCTTTPNPTSARTGADEYRASVRACEKELRRERWRRGVAIDLDAIEAECRVRLGHVGRRR